MQIIAVSNFKGGVGKTSSVLNLGKAFSIIGRRVLLVDIDAQANLSQSLNINDEELTIADTFAKKINFLPIKEITESLHLVPSCLELSAVEPGLYGNINSYFMLKTFLTQLGGKYDFIIIDTPPSIGLWTQNALIAADSTLITVQAQFLSLKGLEVMYDMINNVRVSLNEKLSILGIVMTQTNHTRINKDIVKSLRENFRGNVFTTSIRQNVALAEASAKRKDIFTYDPKSHGAIDYMNLAKEILQ